MANRPLFADRILREMLLDPANLSDLLELTLGEAVYGFDFKAAEYVETTFHLPDLRERRADVLCRVPYEAAGREVLVCVLLEHQSGFDPWMPLRVLEYAVAHWRSTERARDLVDPVLPVVFHTGASPWIRRRQLGDVMAEIPGLVAAPIWPIRYVDLPAISPQRLLRASRPWQQALAVERVVDEYDHATLETVVCKAVAGIWGVFDSNPGRYRHLLEFMLRWVVGRRPQEEHKQLLYSAWRTARPEERDKIMVDLSKHMHLSWDQILEQEIERTHIETLRRALHTILEHRFGELDAAKTAVIEAIEDPQRLEELIATAATAKALDELDLDEQ